MFHMAVVGVETATTSHTLAKQEPIVPPHSLYRVFVTPGKC
jgi:hypothetical protein